MCFLMLIFLGNVIINKNIILIVVVLLMAAPAHAHLFISDLEANTAGRQSIERMAFLLPNGDTGMLIDNIVVTQVPEPAT